MANMLVTHYCCLHFMIEWNITSFVTSCSIKLCDNFHMKFPVNKIKLLNYVLCANEMLENGILRFAISLIGKFGNKFECSNVKT